VKYFFVNPPSAPASSATRKAAFMELERVIYEFAMDAISQALPLFEIAG
jgi:hypothetical protein